MLVARRIRLLLGACSLLSACSHSLSPEEKQQVDALLQQDTEVKKDIGAAEADSARYEGGLIKVLIDARLQILKTNDALLQQRALAVQSRAPVTVQTYATKPDPDTAQKIEAEIAAQQKALVQMQAEAANTGGLIQAMKLSTIATQGQTLAMLQQRYLIAKYGLSYPKVEAATNSPSVATTAPPATVAEAAAVPTAKPVESKPDIQDGVIQVTLESKEFKKQDYQDYVFFNFKYTAMGLDKPARAIKGVIHLNDLFGETKFSIKWSIDKPVNPGETIEEKGTGFKYNQFIDAHQWVNATKVDDMKATFSVTSILYQDGTRRDF